MKRNEYLLKNTIIFAIGNFGTKIISFLLVPLYTGLLTSKEYGTIDLIFTIGTVLIPLLTLNINEAIMRFALDKGEDKKKLINIGFVCLLFCAIFGLLLIPFSSKIDSIYEYRLYIYFYCITAGCSQILLAYLRGIEKLLSYSIGNIINSISIASLNIIFIAVLSKGIKGYFLAYIIANIVTSIYAFIEGSIKSSFKQFEIDGLLFKRMTKYSLALIPNTLMWWIMNSLDRIMISTLISTAANGLFAVAYKIPSILSTFTNVFTVAWSYSAIKENDSEDKEEYNNYIYDKMVKTVIILAMCILCILKPFLRIYVSAEYYIAWKYVPILLIGFIFMTIGSFVATSYTVHKDSIGFMKSGICGAIINIILNYILIKKIGVNGAAISTTISYIAVYIYRVIDTRKYLKLQVINKTHILAYFMLAVACVTIKMDTNLSMICLWGDFVFILILFKDYVKEMSLFVLNILNKTIQKLKSRK